MGNFCKRGEMNNPILENLIGTLVIITTKRNSKYVGKLWKYGDKKIALSELRILSKTGDYKAIVYRINAKGKIVLGSRLFNLSSIKSIEPAKNWLQDLPKININ